MTVRPSDFSIARSFNGRSQFSADPLFAWRVDDFRIDNYGLSLAEVSGNSREASAAAGVALLPAFIPADAVWRYSDAFSAQLAMHRTIDLGQDFHAPGGV